VRMEEDAQAQIGGDAGVTPDNPTASVPPLQQSTKLMRGTLKERVGQPEATDRVSGLWEGKTGEKGREGKEGREGGGEERDMLIKGGGGLGLGRLGRSGEARVQLRVVGEGLWIWGEQGA